MAFSTQNTVLLILVVNITAAIGAFAFGYVQDRIGHVATIAITLVGWIVMIGLAWLAQGACNLGSINLTQFICDPFGKHPQLELKGIADIAAIATRMLDNVIDVSHFPLAVQAKAAHASRRMGLGITGLADAFAMLGVRYGSESSMEIADAVMQTICQAAYLASIALAEERGVFPE